MRLARTQDLGRFADADPDAFEVLGPEAVDDVLDAIVAGSARRLCEAELSGRNVEIVMEHQNVFGFQLIELHDNGYCITGEVHQGLRFEKSDLLVILFAARKAAAKFLLPLPERESPSLPQVFQSRKSGIVPGVRVFFSGVSQSDDEFHKED